MKGINKATRLKIFIGFSVLAYVVHIISGIWGEKYLYGDTVNYFYTMLETGHPMIQPLGRRTCDVLMAMFMICGYQLGCTSIPVMGALYGLGLTFWPVLFYALAMGICISHKRTDYAEILLLLSMASIIFSGFYLLIESVLALSFFVLQMVLILLHKDEKKLSAFLEIILMILCLAMDIHCNEFFSFWSWILAFTALYRVLCAKEKLHPIWLLWGGAQIGIALFSRHDIAYRGSSPDVWDTCLGILAHKWHMVWLLLIVANVLVSLERVKLPRKKYIVVGFRFLLFAASLIWLMGRTGFIVSQSAPMRFSNLAFGVLIGIILLMLENWRDFFKMQDLTVVCAIIAFCFCLFNVKSAVEHRAYNDEILAFAEEHAGEGFVECRDSGLLESDYRFSWVTGYKAIALHGVRGIKMIDCIPIAPDDRYKEKKISDVLNMDRYGLFYDYDAFE